MHKTTFFLQASWVVTPSLGRLKWPRQRWQHPLHYHLSRWNIKQSHQNWSGNLQENACPRFRLQLLCMAGWNCTETEEAAQRIRYLASHRTHIPINEHWKNRHLDCSQKIHSSHNTHSGECETDPHPHKPSIGLLLSNHQHTKEALRFSNIYTKPSFSWALYFCRKFIKIELAL